MSYFKTCPLCGAHLDPGEVCECKREAVPGTANAGRGKAEQVDKAISASIVNDNEEDCKG